MGIDLTNERTQTFSEVKVESWICSPLANTLVYLGLVHT